MVTRMVLYYLLLHVIKNTLNNNNTRDMECYFLLESSVVIPSYLHSSDFLVNSFFCYRELGR